MRHSRVTINFGSAKVCSAALFETCFSYDRYMDCCNWLLYVLYIILLFQLKAILQLIFFTAS